MGKETVREKIKQLLLRMPEGLHKRIGHVAVERETCLTRCILSLLEERLEELEAPRAIVPNGQHAQKEL